MKTEIVEVEKNKVCFEWKEFSDKFIYRVKQITNPNGQGNCSYKPEILPQDTLAKAYGWLHGKTGITCQFIWESGRKDAYCVSDIDTKENTEFSQIFKAIFLNQDQKLLIGDVNGH